MMYGTTNLQRELQHIVGIGELLFDVHDQQTSLGGAPVNFSYHAHQLLSQFGYQGHVVSAVGDDDLGTRAIDELRTAGLTISSIQHHDTLATGTARVHSVAGGHDFEIVENVSWDSLNWNSSLEALAKITACVCFGTLGQRHPKSRSTIRHFIEQCPKALKLFDVNLRQTYFDSETLLHGCQNANILKMSADEIPLVMKHTQTPSATDPVKSCQTLLDRFSLDYVIYTAGADGTTLLTADQVIRGDHPKVQVANAVGAGDACAAGIITGLLRKLELSHVVDIGNRMGARVAGEDSATCPIPRELITSWLTS
ncbi:MAG: PfkB family carbohydrate kinase [Planctomycetota bacterium]|nr:PfkB family carbohydrate kinase [Planctomycetota bacterium]